jgi:hypothetical protein
MIISIRYVPNNWHWEVWAPTSKYVSSTWYAAGISPTWKEMMSQLEVKVSELEKDNETRLPKS